MCTTQEGLDLRGYPYTLKSPFEQDCLAGLFKSLGRGRGLAQVIFFDYILCLLFDGITTRGYQGPSATVILHTLTRGVP
jgi:hypothetical protein